MLETAPALLTTGLFIEQKKNNRWHYLPWWPSSQQDGNFLRLAGKEIRYPRHMIALNLDWYYDDYDVCDGFGLPLFEAFYNVYDLNFFLGPPEPLPDDYTRKSTLKLGEATDGADIGDWTDLQIGEISMGVRILEIPSLFEAADPRENHYGLPIDISKDLRAVLSLLERRAFFSEFRPVINQAAWWTLDEVLRFDWDRRYHLLISSPADIVQQLRQRPAIAMEDTNQFFPEICGPGPALEQCLNNLIELRLKQYPSTTFALTHDPNAPFDFQLGRDEILNRYPKFPCQIAVKHLVTQGLREVFLADLAIIGNPEELRLTVVNFGHY
jgi:hypothetical protein